MNYTWVKVSQLSTAHTNFLKIHHFPLFISNLYIQSLVPNYLFWYQNHMNNKSTLVIVGTDCRGNCQSKYHTITASTVPAQICMNLLIWYICSPTGVVRFVLLFFLVFGVVLCICLSSSSVLCTQCFQYIWIVYSRLPLRLFPNVIYDEFNSGYI